MPSGSRPDDLQRRQAKRRGGFARYAYRASAWRRFDRLSSFSYGLVPIGDSICRFNPIYGQGMSAAAQEACLLNQLLKGRVTKANPLAGLALAFFSEGLPLVEAPRNMSAVPDLVYPETRGECPAHFKSRLKYNGALIRTAIHDPAVHRLLTEVHQLLKPPRPSGSGCRPAGSV